MVVFILIRLLLVAGFLWFIYRLVFGSSRSRLGNVKCSTCRHAGLLDEDGVLCRYGARETFKNSVHIGNCLDFQPRS